MVAAGSHNILNLGHPGSRLWKHPSLLYSVYGLAAWIAVGHDRISYIGLQISLAFDLTKEISDTTNRSSSSRLNNWTFEKVAE